MLSIIIPTLNEEDYLGQCLENIKAKSQRPEEIEVLVVDSGSHDKSVAIAKKTGCKVLSLKKKKENTGNKYRALNFGAQHAKGEILFFLDADSIPPPQFDFHIYELLKDPQIIGGAFHFCLMGKGLSLRFIELINRIRYSIWKRYYGDQGIFVRRTSFEKVGAYPACRILEASKLCEKLKQEGRLKLIPLCMQTSARRFLEGGIWRVFLHDVRICFYDLIGLETEKFAAAYWAYNEKSNH